MELMYKRKVSCWKTICTNIKPHYTHTQSQGEKCLLDDSNIWTWRISSYRNSVYSVHPTAYLYLLGGILCTKNNVYEYFMGKLIWTVLCALCEYIIHALQKSTHLMHPGILWEKPAWVITMIYWSSGPSDPIWKWNWLFYLQVHYLY